MTRRNLELLIAVNIALAGSLILFLAWYSIITTQTALMERVVEGCEIEKEETDWNESRPGLRRIKLL